LRILKGLILSGGKGTRLRPITYTSAKQLVPVANKPVLFYGIEYMVEAGITDIGIVVGDTRDEIKSAVGNGDRWGAKITYIPQEAPLGLAHAVKIAQPYLGDDRFVMYLGDNMIEGGFAPFVREYLEGGYNCEVLLKKVPNPQQYGVAVVDGGRVRQLVEKPQELISDLALVGVYMFDAHVFEAVNAIQPSRRGELEITDAIQYLLDHDYSIHAHELQGWWFDTGKMEDMLEVNRLVLDTLEPSIGGYVDADSQILGKVTLGKSTEVINSVIRGPVIIRFCIRVPPLCYDRPAPSCRLWA
jgi:glucose-1-phosphate thymidylyltransferase